MGTDNFLLLNNPGGIFFWFTLVLFLWVQRGKWCCRLSFDVAEGIKNRGLGAFTRLSLKSSCVSCRWLCWAFDEFLVIFKSGFGWMLDFLLRVTTLLYFDSYFYFESKNQSGKKNE